MVGIATADTDRANHDSIGSDRYPTWHKCEGSTYCAEQGGGEWLVKRQVLRLHPKEDRSFRLHLSDFDTGQECPTAAQKGYEMAPGINNSNRTGKIFRLTRAVCSGDELPSQG